MPWLTDRRLLIAAVAAWMVVAVIGVAIGPPLGHDEAAFAITACGDEPAGAWLYRSDGTVALARLGVALGGAEWGLRLVSALVSVGVVLAAFAVGRAAFSRRTGAWAAAVVAGAHPMALRSAQLLSDLPAAACLLSGIAVVVGELQREHGASWRVVAAAPLLAAAFYLRYGSAPVIGLVLGVAVAMWWRAMWQRPLRWMAMAAVLAVLLVPHLARSTEATGAALGILKVSAAMPRRAYVGEGLMTYVTSNPLELYGSLIAPAMLAGLASLVRTRRKVPWYLGIVGLGQLVALGLQSHAQPRYVFVATVLLVVLGVDAARRLPWPRVGLGLVTAAWIGVVAADVVLCALQAERRGPIVRAAEVIRRDAGGRPCAVAALLAPQLTWYSGCQVYVAALGSSLPADRARYAVSLTHWPIDVAAEAAARQLRATPIATGDPDAAVWRLE